MKKILSLFLFAILLLGCELLNPTEESVSNVSNPVIAPGGRDFSEATNISITTQTEGAEIRYTTDGSEPTVSFGTIYTGEILVSESVTIKAIAYKKGYNPSAVVTESYIVNISSSPVFSLEAGTYENIQDFTITTSTVDGVIYYTVDGSVPSVENYSSFGTNSVTVSLDHTMDVKAIVVKEGFGYSEVVTVRYVFMESVSSPAFSIVEDYITENIEVTISSETTGATIYYTIDGTIPTTSSASGATVTITETTTLKAIAVKDGWVSSGVSTKTYTYTGKVAAPVFNVISSYITESTVVTLSSATAGATIYYTIDGSTPTTSSTSGSTVTITSTTSLKAMAVKDNWAASDVSTKTYTYTGQVASPTFSGASETITGAANAVISTSTAGATLYYTIDGTTPSSSNYEGTGTTTITLSVSETVTLKAIAVLENWSDSAVSIKQYTLAGQVVAPEFSISSDYVTESTEVVISTSTTGATIYYTVNGTTPSASNKAGSGTDSVNVTVSSTTTLKAIAVITGAIDSSVSSKSYTYTGQVSAPTFDVSADYLTSSTVVTISTSTTGATIYYTVDGSTPTSSSTLYVGAITISSTLTLEAIAVKSNWANSEVTEKLYTYTGKVAAPSFDVTSNYLTESTVVNLSSTTSEATIYYTIDGSVPTSSSILYDGAITISSTLTLKAIAVKENWTSSDVSTKAYTYTGKVGSPQFSVTDSVLVGNTDVEITSDSGATIYYTIDGSVPTSSSTLYDGAITISSTLTLKAIAVKTNWVNSDITTNSYVLCSLYPVPGSTGAYIDGELIITFDSVPTIETEGSIFIYKASDDSLVDTINFANETLSIDGETINVKDQLVRVVGNVVYIKPHLDILEYDTEYYAVISDSSMIINSIPLSGFASDQWAFTTKSTPTLTSNITVDSSKTSSADFKTLQAALDASSNGDTITLEPGLYYERINYAGGNDITIVGNTTTEYGSDVIVQYKNSNAYNASSSTRGVFHWKGGDLILKNITIQNTYDRNIEGTAQAEALYFDNSTSKLAAYNSSFLSHQDTLLTKGKNWFYKCYIEGDTDFIWGYADVCLLEECEIVALDTSSDTVSTSLAALFETRVSSDSTSTTTVGKGYVVFNSSFEANHPSTYFARRASSSKSAGLNYYDQVAIIDTTITGTGLKADPWYVGNTPVYIDKDVSGNMNVGWKAYNLTGASVVDANVYAGTITADLYGAEYDGRAVILNREYKKSGSYANSTDIWDISSLETDFTAETDNSEFSTIVVSGANGSYDIIDYAESGAVQNDTITDGTSSDGYISWTGMKYHGTTYGATTSAGTISIDVEGASVISYSTYSGQTGSITVTDSDSNTVLGSYSTAGVSTFSFLYETDTATTLTLTFSGTNYIGTLSVAVLTDEVVAVSSVSVTGTSSMALGDTATFTAAVSGTYCPSSAVTWSSDAGTIVSVDSSTGLVTALSAGTGNITATSVVDGTVSGSLEVTVTSSAVVATVGNIYGWEFQATSPTSPLSDENYGLKMEWDESPSYNSGYGVYGVAVNYQIPVAGDATIIAYSTYGAGDVILSTSGDVVIGTRTKSSGDAKPAAGPIALVWRYTGSADTLNLAVPSGVYIGRIVADNTATPSALTVSTYDFTVEANCDAQVEPDTGDNALVYYSSATAAWHSAQYGLQSKGNTYVSFLVGGACNISIVISLDNVSAGSIDLYDNGVITTEAVTLDGSNGTKTLTYSGTEATVLSIYIPKNVYITSIGVSN